MIQSTVMMSILANGLQIKETEFDSLGRIIEQSFDKGFKKAKFNNNIKLINNQRNDSYGESLSRWN